MSNIEASIVYGSLDLTRAPFLWEFGGDFGGPELVKNALAQQLQDGEIVNSPRASNRTLTLTVLTETKSPIYGWADLAEAASAEALLVAECDRDQNTVTFDPGDGVAAVTVFDTFKADLVYQRDDELEQQGFRRWLLTIPALPYPRSDSSVTATIPAPTASDPVTPTVTSVDDCDYVSVSAAQAAGWSVGPGDSLLVEVDQGRVRSWITGERQWALLKKTFSSPLDMSSTPYFIVDASCNSADMGPQFIVNGAVVAPVAQAGTKYWVPAPASVTSLAVNALVHPGGGIAIADISRTDMVSGGTLTQREVWRQFAVQGSVRTPASISVHGVDPSTDSDAILGQALVYTTRAAGVFSPALRGYLVTGPTEATDVTAYSGKSSPLSTTHYFDLDTDSVADAGYLLAARVKASSSGAKTISWQTTTRLNGVAVDTAVTGTTTVNITTADFYEVITLGCVRLPETQVGSDGKVRIQLSSTTLVLDDAWAFDVDHGQVSILDAGASPRLWLDAPTTDRPVPSIWVGTKEDRSDAYIPGGSIQSFGSHEVVGGEVVNVLVACAAPPEVGLSYSPRWHTHAGQVTS